MKKILITLLAGIALTIFAAPRKIVVSGQVKNVGDVQIVANTGIPVLRYAAKELQTFLKQITGKNVAVTSKSVPGKFNIILGDTPESRKAGLDFSKLPDEGYYIRRSGNRLYIAGKDSPTEDPVKKTWVPIFKRGTLSGVYDFLERFTGTRLFFPGKYGTIVPARGGLFLPAKIDITERPDMLIRTVYYGTCKSYDPAVSMAEIKRSLHYRFRLSEKNIYFGHGLNFLDLLRRFGKTNPEYFALRDDGKRYNDPTMRYPGQLCFTSGVCEEIYQDVKAYFSGKPASSRGMRRWHHNVASDDFFCVMPQDSMYWCRCEKCRKIAKPEDVFTPKGRQAISNHMFKFTADMANRLTREGLKGNLSQMVYLPYDMIPDCQIPANVYLQIAVNGTVSNIPEREIANQWIIDWNKKTGRNVSVWTYAMGKHMSKNIPGIPAMMPKETARFMQKYKKYLNGAFYEAETEKYIFNYLNFYVMGKVMWDSSLDVNKLLDDHYKVMFGKGAPFVRKVFEEMESCWINRFVNNTILDELGPKTRTPGAQQIWGDIYSPERLQKWENLFKSARRAAAGDAAAMERIDFIRKQFLGPLNEAQKKFQEIQSSFDSWNVHVPGHVYLRPCVGEVNEVNSRIDLALEKDHLVLRADFEEPRMNDLLAKSVKNDDKNLWADSVMEFMINPAGDRKTYYQFIINANGAVSDYIHEPGKKGSLAWNSGATGKGFKEKGRWKAELRIPLKSLGKLAPRPRINFGRHRALKGKEVKEIYYHWSPMPMVKRGGFHAVEKWGTMTIGKEPEKLIPYGDFDKDTPRKGWRGWWLEGKEKGGQKGGFDEKIFISGGRSLYFKNVKGLRISSGFTIPGMKPGKKYRLSYYIRTKNVQGGTGAGAFLYYNQKDGDGYPKLRISGTHPWHRLVFDITAPPDTGKGMAPILGLWIWFAEGEVWFDKVELTEIK